MISYIDNEFAMRFFSYQRNYNEHSTNPMRLQCSCPVCGDSATDSSKARFWYYHWKGSNLVHCFNCDFTAGIGKFLEEYDETLYREYLMEKRKEMAFGNDVTTIPKRKEVDIASTFTKKLEMIECLDYCVRLDTLPANHPIVKYVKERCIPPQVYDRLFFTSQWQDLVNKTKQTFDHPRKEYRLVIPFYNKEGKIESYQGRSLDPNAKIRYMTIKAHEDASKIYGMKWVDDKSDIVFVMEGPIDSMFIPNSIAIAGGSLDLEKVPYPDKRVWVLDNEPRHKDVKNRVRKLIDAGERVVLWDGSGWTSKDINDMIKNGEATADEIESFLKDNIVDGLMAELRFNNYFMV